MNVCKERKIAIRAYERDAVNGHLLLIWLCDSAPGFCLGLSQQGETETNTP